MKNHQVEPIHQVRLEVVIKTTINLQLEEENKMKKIFFLLFFIPIFGLTQDFRDLVRYSQTQTYGSARFEAMAGSFGALGADLSTSSINPAGYGRYSKSTFGLSFQNTGIKNQAVFNSNAINSNLNLFRLNNLGVVLCNDVSENNRGFIFTQIGFTYNRIENFKDEYSYAGQQFHSLLDEFCSQAYGLNSDEIYSYLPFSTALAWDTYAIDSDSDGGYIPRLNEYDVIHKRNVLNGGGSSEYNFNLSTNYNHKLYVGGNIGFRTSLYKEDYTHLEQVTNTEGISIDSFQYEYHLKTKGHGTNIKLGVIYVPIEQFRIGLSFHSPTFFKMKDYFSADMTTYQNDSVFTVLEEFKPVGEYKYLLRTPTKFIFSMAYVFATRGSINVDLDFVNYKWAHFHQTDDTNYEPFDYAPTNKFAKTQLRPVINVRIGGELVFLSQYFIRAGYAYYPSAYNQSLNSVKDNQVYSCGIGLKWKKNCVDLAYKYEDRQFSYYAFSESRTAINQKRTSISINYSFNF